MRDYFLFYRSFFESIRSLPPDAQAEIYPVIIAYALDDIWPPDDISPLTRSIFLLAKPIIDSNNRRRDNGCRGGAPRGNQNARKKTTKNNQKQPKVNSKNNQESTEKQPNNVYYNNILSSTDVESNNYSNIEDVELNKFNINNNKENPVDVDDAAEKFFLEISKREFFTQACQALSISERDFFSYAQTIVAEWKISGIKNFLPENTPSTHLINQMRIKRDSPSENKAQSRFCDIVKRKQAEEEEKQKQRQEREEREKCRGGQQAFREKMGLKEGESITVLLTRPSEGDALTEYRKLNPQ